MRIIPALDILDGKCVRLTKGDFSTGKIYNDDPVDAARVFENAGLRYIHLVDLDGARAKRLINYRIIEKIAESTKLIIDLGGGIRTDSDLEKAFSSGVSQVTAGSIAVSSPETLIKWIEKFGASKIILGADTRNNKISINGWEQDTGTEVRDFIRDYAGRGIEYVICTDVGRDGMLQGPATELYSDILKEVKINLIASGGVASINDINLLRETGCEGVIIGKAIYEGKIRLSELKDLC